VRHSLIAALALLVAVNTACADAPITADDIQADGQLRPDSQPSAQQSVHASNGQQLAQQAEHLRVTGLLAAQAEGPLEDATQFATTSEAIHLHLRADDLTEPRPVTFVWIHGDDRRETMGFLQPSETISLAASLPLARLATTLEAEPERIKASNPIVPVPEQPFIPVAGTWKVEVYSAESLVFEREFEVTELLADAS
jgi:hypothetical protein